MSIGSAPLFAAFAQDKKADPYGVNLCFSTVTLPTPPRRFQDGSR